MYIDEALVYRIISQGNLQLHIKPRLVVTIMFLHFEFVCNNLNLVLPLTLSFATVEVYEENGDTAIIRFQLKDW